MLILPTNTIKTAGTMRAISKAIKTSITMISTTIKERQLQGSNPIMVRAAMGSWSFMSFRICAYDLQSQAKAPWS